MKDAKKNQRKVTDMNRTPAHKIGLVGLAIMATALSACATAPAPSATPGAEQVFVTPEQAVNAYVTAVRSDDKAGLLKILGPDADTLIHSGDPVADKNGRDKFLAAYDAAHKIDEANDDEDLLVIGDEEWPLPIPLVQNENGWHWDTAAGKEEILNRRIGRNELNAIGVCRAYVEAQRDYAATHHTHNGTPEYAQKFVSTHGKHDGLYWPAQNGEAESPLGPLVAEARAEGYTSAGTHHAHTPYHGYFYKILKSQGANASEGAKDYVTHGHMVGGFALLAFPAKYGDSGVMSFIVNQNGIVHEKNLGADTPSIAAQMNVYDPDDSWDINSSVD